MEKTKTIVAAQPIVNELIVSSESCEPPKSGLMQVLNPETNEYEWKYVKNFPLDTLTKPYNH